MTATTLLLCAAILAQPLMVAVLLLSRARTA
jgi:hypothetical protein